MVATKRTTQVLYCVVLATGMLCHTAFADVTQGAIPFVLKNAVADAIVPLSGKANWQINGLSTCRSLVVEELTNKASRVGLINAHRLVGELASGTARISVADSQILISANEVLSYLENNSFAASCINAVVINGEIASRCTESISSLREFALSSLMRMSAVTAAITETIGAKCDVRSNVSKQSTLP